MQHLCKINPSPLDLIIAGGGGGGGGGGGLLIVILCCGCHGVAIVNTCTEYRPNFYGRLDRFC